MSKGSEPPRWDHFPHQADVGIRGYGPTKEQAFEQAALALTGVMVDPGPLAGACEVAIDCNEPDDGLLLVDWLNALIFETVTRKVLFSRFEVHLEGHHLQAKAWGQPISECPEPPAVEPKGATQTALLVREVGPHAWVAQCVVDV